MPLWGVSHWSHCVCFQSLPEKWKTCQRNEWRWHSWEYSAHSGGCLSLSDPPGGCRRSGVGTVHLWGKFRTAAERMSAAYKWASSWVFGWGCCTHSCSSVATMGWTGESQREPGENTSVEEVDSLWRDKVASISNSGAEKGCNGRRRWDQHDTH